MDQERAAEIMPRKNRKKKQKKGTPKSKLFYGNHKIPWKTREGVRAGCIMIHRGNCYHMRHVEMEQNSENWHYAYGDLGWVKAWANTMKEKTEFPIYFCTQCKPPRR